ncbi:chromosomal replication initiator protein [Desulfobaculum xiamenense]|uniref:Chromosomal replication initiator protein DnaA n=1 Tax=Desulfobaculum xiamenense TaxID=995050 RepID=A0A846QVW8_9BACT|nr:chromosomal replication initiator protein DnaA [Desulfobaculum xiamenense]NJB68779.1 chromosomal replication initiator protein [Desulfobaculum xiamenense]
MSEAWAQITDILAKTTGPGTFKVWIKPLDAEMSERGLTLLAPNSFVASWVSDRLSSDIADAATQVLGRRPLIEIKVRPRERQKVRPQQMSLGAMTAPAPARREPAQPVQAAEPVAAVVSAMAAAAANCAPHAARPAQQPVAPAVHTGRAAAAEQFGLPNLMPTAPKTFTYTNWRFRFDDFVVGPCNQLAFAAANGICRDQLATHQLFLNSSPGLGKTHLLHAIGSQIAGHSNRSSVRVGYATAEEFNRQLIHAIKAKEVERFKAQYRDSLDVLLLEDVHFLQGKQVAQDEMLATLNALENRGCKVVMSSSFLPRELKDVDSQLASRLCAGFLATIDAPDFDTRRRILDSKARMHQVVLPGDVSEYLADNLRDDVRQIESCIQNLVLKARLLGEHITMDLAAEILQNYTISSEARAIGLQKIVKYICSSFELTYAQLSSKSRKHNIVLARNTAFFLARKYTDLGLKQIGDQFNRRHSTVLKGITNVEREISLQTPLGRQLDNVIERIKSF